MLRLRPNSVALLKSGGDCRSLAVPLRRAVGHGKIRRVPLGSDLIRSARDVGISVGD